MTLPRAQTADTLQAVTNTDVLVLTIERTPGGIVCRAFYQVRLSGGAIAKRAELPITLTAQALADLSSFLTNRVVPTINAQDS